MCLLFQKFDWSSQAQQLCHVEEILCYVLVTLTKNLSAFYKFMKTHQFQFQNDFSIWESPDLILWKKIKIK